MSMQILIVDDDKFVRRVLREAFEQDGIECHEAASGLEALRMAREIHPDAVILDVMLPGLDGYKICRMLKYDENFADISIVMVTSRARQSDRETGYHTGADHYITKPFKPEEVVAAVKQLRASKATAD
jgi:two-component system alkaline phosphatase synthesis response regulator PhoP